MAKQRKLGDTRGKQKKEPAPLRHHHCEQLRTMDRANRRQEEIDSGINPRSGSGVHGGGKHERKRLSARKGSSRRAVRKPETATGAKRPQPP